MSDDLQNKLRTYVSSVNVEELDALWERQSRAFRDFWTGKILNEKYPTLTDADIDEIVLILDKNAKGSTKSTVAVAKAMIAQGVWRRLFREIQSKKKLNELVYSILNETDPRRQTEQINGVYRLNEDAKNSLTGRSGNALNTMLFAFAPTRQVAVISLKHRKAVIDRYRLACDVDFERDSPGKKIVNSNLAIIEGFKKLGVDVSPYHLSHFLYTTLRAEWRPTDEAGAEEPAEVEPEGQESKATFYMERELENFLIANWDRTELGQKYELIEEDGEIVSQQYPTGIGKIDILAKDRKTAQYVVIELKKNQTSDDTIGQLTRYLGWIDEHRPGGKTAKGIIIASGYDVKLAYAMKRVRDVEVYTYQVDFKLTEFTPSLSRSGRRRHTSEAI